jgi:hypothetical protein
MTNKNIVILDDVRLVLARGDVLGHRDKMIVGFGHSGLPALLRTPVLSLDVSTRYT